jgi:hypothetical protein
MNMAKRKYTAAERAAQGRPSVKRKYTEDERAASGKTSPKRKRAAAAREDDGGGFEFPFFPVLLVIGFIIWKFV